MEERLVARVAGGPRLVGGVRVGRAEVLAGDCGEAADDAGGEAGKLVVGGLGQGGEGPGPVGAGHEQAVGQEGVGVGKERQALGKPVQEDHGAGRAVPDAHLPAALALPGEEGAQEDAEHPGEEFSIH